MWYLLLRTSSRSHEGFVDALLSAITGAASARSVRVRVPPAGSEPGGACAYRAHGGGADCAAGGAARRGARGRAVMYVRLDHRLRARLQAAMLPMPSQRRGEAYAGGATRERACVKATHGNEVDSQLVRAVSPASRAARGASVLRAAVPWLPTAISRRRVLRFARSRRILARHHPGHSLATKNRVSAAGIEPATSRALIIF